MQLQEKVLNLIRDQSNSFPDTIRQKSVKRFTCNPKQLKRRKLIRTEEHTS